MDLVSALKERPFMLYDGPMETRIEYGTTLKLDKEMSIFTLIYQEEGQKALRQLYETDIEAVRHHNAPIILNAPTYRASPAHCQRLHFNDPNAIETINQDCIQFVKNIRNRYDDYKNNIYITAPIGPELAGYSADLSFTVEKAVSYHSRQANAIAQAGVDIISIAAMAGMIETIGCATAVAQTGMPYSVGVILNPDGTLIDGNPLKELIARIDATISPQPNFYIISCTHPVTAEQALSDHDIHYQRILGIKANGSSKSGKELLNIDHPEADEPELFADELIALGTKYHFKIYGGCCGTDHRHLATLAEKLTK